MLHDLTGALDDRPRQPGELRHVDAVGAVRAAGDDLVQEDDAVALLGHGHAEIAHARQHPGQVGEFVVVRREQRLGAQARMVVMNPGIAGTVLDLAVRIEDAAMSVLDKQTLSDLIHRPVLKGLD